MEQEYDINVKNIAIFGGLIVSVVASVAVVYGLIYGFGNLSTSVVGASKVMVAAFNQPQPMPQTGMQGLPPSNPQFGQVAVQPLAQPPQQIYAQPYAVPQTTGPVTGQYLCPQHGAVGLPNYDANGMTYCPICSQPMQLNCPPQSPLTTVAAAG